MKALLGLAVSTVVVAANVYAVEMADFELDLEHRGHRSAGGNIEARYKRCVWC